MRRKMGGDGEGVLVGVVVEEEDEEEEDNDDDDDEVSPFLSFSKGRVGR